MIIIEQVETVEQTDAIRDMVREFVEYALTLDPEATNAHAFADLEQQLADLPGEFGPPTGSLLLATVDGKAAGCAAFFGHDEDVCEVKRMYVRPDYRGLHLGEKLIQSLIQRARESGYQKMVLDTFHKLKAAQSLYAKAGFVVCAPTMELPEFYQGKIVRGRGYICV